MTLDADELATVFETADHHLLGGDHDALYNLLQPISDGRAVVAANLGRCADRSECVNNLRTMHAGSSRIHRS